MGIDQTYLRNWYGESEQWKKFNVYRYEGRWHHYDTFHFEYRPELFAPACLRVEPSDTLDQELPDGRDSRNVPEGPVSDEPELVALEGLQ